MNPTQYEEATRSYETWEIDKLNALSDAPVKQKSVEMYMGLGGDGYLANGSPICLDCLLECNTIEDKDAFDKLEKPDPILACAICGARAIDPATIERNQPMIDFINSISTGAYLK